MNIDSRDISSMSTASNAFTEDEGFGYHPRSAPSFPASPVRASPPVVSAEKSLTAWFERMLCFRKMESAVLHAVFSFFLFVICACVLQISLFHPLQSVQDIFSVLFSTATILFASLFAVLNGLVTFAIGYFVLRFDCEKRLSMRDFLSWSFFFVLLIADNMRGFMLFKCAGITFVNKLADVPFFFVHVPLVIVTFMNVFRFNYQLTPPAVELSLWRQMRSAFPAENEKTLEKLGKVTRWTVVHTLTFGLLIFGWPLFPGLLTAEMYFPTALLAYLQILLHCLAVRILKILILQRYTFTIPPPYVVAEPTPEQRRTITNALDSTSVDLQAFAFWDLRTLASMHRQRRVALFCLSQPGGHPRNWDAVKSACLRWLEFVRARADEENLRIRQSSFAAVKNHVDAGTLNQSARQKGPTILLPNQLHKDQNLRYRILAGNASNAKAEVTKSRSGISATLRYFKSYFAEEGLVVSSYHANIAALSIESLCMLIWNSYEEDRYGVVQKDLQSILSLMIQLLIALDKYLRAAKQVDSTYRNVNVYRFLENTLNSALSRIATKFGNNLKSIQLSPQHMGVMEMLTGLA